MGTVTLQYRNWVTTITQAKLSEILSDSNLCVNIATNEVVVTGPSTTLTLKVLHHD